MALGERIAAIESAKAKERMTAGVKQPSANLAEGPEDRRARTKVAKAVGMGRTSYAKAKAVVAAAEDDRASPQRSR
ncbi:MAG: hypothetical protein ACR2LJ_05945 [Acidimicrobiales bacterium]